jgi:transcriptional regulator with XRE-family HTH domain
MAWGGDAGMPWYPDGDAIRTERERRGLTLAELGELAKITEKTLWRLESGETGTIRPTTLVALARALDCNKEALATRAPGITSAGVPLTRPASARRTVTADDDESLSVAVAPPEAARRFSSRTLQSLSTAFRAHEHRRYAWNGRVKAQVPLSPLERFALGCDSTGIGARFVVTLGAGRASARVSLHATSARTTLELQSRLESGAPTVLTARVAVCETSDEHPTVHDPRDIEKHDFYKRWRGFTCEGFDTLVPWALVAEDVDSDELSPPRAQRSSVNGRGA